jgi:RHS repeat-associated protein
MAAMQRYEQAYGYDPAGNMLSLVHNAGNGALIHRWTKTLTYAPGNNRLLNHEAMGLSTAYNYDDFGNMLNLDGAGFLLTWNFSGHLSAIDLGGGGKAWYVYDHSGQRIRKVVENGGLKKETIYLGDLEIYRESNNGVPGLKRETLHAMDGTKRFALFEKRTAGMDSGLDFLVRYQYGNHLGSCSLELTGDPLPEIISYEEYYPFGSTAHAAARNQTETPKRYRFNGKERDAESGLYYYGARYYAPWLLRWTTADPAGGTT